MMSVVKSLSPVFDFPRLASGGRMDGEKGGFDYREIYFNGHLGGPRYLMNNVALPNTKVDATMKRAAQEEEKGNGEET